MPPYRSQLDSDSENEAPELVSLSESKKTAKKQHENVRKAVEEQETAVKKARKDRNREVDRRMKERAQKRKSDFQPGEEEEDAETTNNDVEARMLRAMQQAEAESGSELGELDDEEEGSVVSEEDEEDDIEEDEGSQDEDDEDEEIEDHEDDLTKSNHLPDHIFASAFSQPLKDVKIKKLSKPVKKRKKFRKGPKDAIVGSRAIRTLSDPNNALPKSTSRIRPSAKVNKFLNRSLGLKAGQEKLKTRGWERRAVNLGSLRRQVQGPAAHFVRST
ncbi:hypothetical protein VKT23_015112 [Stygiomarasmius scandens]|uniref:Uncharacterized protein n=1 Tax=Marasmiellus scandens TaxID=2682957 RepID=A0ABR1IYJ1_9AGAR